MGFSIEWYLVECTGIDAGGSPGTYPPKFGNAYDLPPLSPNILAATNIFDKSTPVPQWWSGIFSGVAIIGLISACHRDLCSEIGT